MPSYEFTKINSSKIVPHIEGKKSIVLHHMDGCIHCQMFKPVWKKITEHYKNSPDCLLVSVEYSSMGLLPKNMQNVQGFPTIRAYRNATPVAEFNDIRTYDTVIDFIEKYGKNTKDSKPKIVEKSKPKKKTSIKKKVS